MEIIFGRLEMPMTVLLGSLIERRSKTKTKISECVVVPKWGVDGESVLVLLCANLQMMSKERGSKFK